MTEKEEVETTYTPDVEELLGEKNDRDSRDSGDREEGESLPEN